jgi:hypothetical protein
MTAGRANRSGAFGAKGAPERIWGSHAGLDPKNMMGDIGERMKGVAFEVDKSEEPGETERGGRMPALGSLSGGSSGRAL